MLVFLYDELCRPSHVNVEFNVGASGDVVEDYFVGILSGDDFESRSLSPNEKQAIPILLIVRLA